MPAGDPQLLEHQRFPRRGFSKRERHREDRRRPAAADPTGKYIGYLPEHYAWPLDQIRLRVLLPTSSGFSRRSANCKRGRSNEPYLKAFRRPAEETRWRGRSGLLSGAGAPCAGGDSRFSALPSGCPCQNETAAGSPPGLRAARQLPPGYPGLGAAGSGQVAGDRARLN